MSIELSEQELFRRQSLTELRNMGIEPYPAAEYPTNAFSTDIKTEFKDEDTRRQVCVAGRIMSRRIMGKASFVELQDSKGRIQVYVSRDDINTEAQPEMYNTVFKKLLDIGDFIGIKGFVFRTQMGEISVHAQEMTVLSKSLKPLPIVKYKDGVAYDAFEDPEQRYRQLAETNPGLVKRVTQRDLASYLNVTEASLSRIVKRVRDIDSAAEDDLGIDEFNDDSVQLDAASS